MMLRGRNSCNGESLGLAQGRSPYGNFKFWGRGNPPWLHCYARAVKGFPALPKKERRDRAFLFYDGSHAKISKPTF